jgi:hypothetical protein
VDTRDRETASGRESLVRRHHRGLPSSVPKRRRVCPATLDRVADVLAREEIRVRRSIKAWVPLLSLTVLAVTTTQFMLPQRPVRAEPAPAPGAAPARPMTVKVAAVQCSSDLGAVDANRKKLTKLVEEAADNGAKIVVLPKRPSPAICPRILRPTGNSPAGRWRRISPARIPPASPSRCPGYRRNTSPAWPNVSGFT